VLRRSVLPKRPLLSRRSLFLGRSLCLPAAALIVAAGLVSGCATPTMTCPRVIFVDGAGWFTGDSGVREGLKAAGYPGPVARFGWSMGLAPMDHALAGPEHPRTHDLAGRITDLRRANPAGQIVVMGLSSGTAMIVYALAELPSDVRVDDVVLLSPSVSGRTDLRDALAHVKGRMFVTINPSDPLLALGDSSGPEPGEPAGRSGFISPVDLSMDPLGGGLYMKVQYIPWKEEYAAMGWKEGHVGTTSAKFIQMVIAPKIMPAE
jgi:pimeloyl-ACP methyl ester carboxylesterase